MPSSGGTLMRMRGVLRHRDFRLLWLAQSSSVVGDQLVTVALALYIVQKTGSATDVGLVLAAHVLPLVAFLLIGGVWADRVARQRLMMATDLARFALHGVLAALIFAGEARIWELVAIEVLFGTAEAFSRPAANGLLPQTVPERDIQPATAMQSLSNNVAEFSGPALATALVLAAGAGWAFALDAATFLASAAFLSRLRPRQRTGQARLPDTAVAAGSDGWVATRSGTDGEVAARSGSDGETATRSGSDGWVAARSGSDGETAARAEREATPRRGHLLKEIREGAREVRSRTWVWATLASFCGGVFFGVAPWFVLGPSVARQQYGHIAVYGIVQAALGAGTIAGSLLGVRWRPRLPMRAALLAITTVPAATVLYALGVALALVIPATVASGAGLALFDVWWVTALAQRIPPASLSRVSSYDWMVSLALLPVGYVLAGPLAASLGAVNVLLVGSALSTGCFALGLLPRETRMLQRLDDGEAASVALEQPVGLPRHP